jgi:hypothetical protein
LFEVWLNIRRSRPQCARRHDVICIGIGSPYRGLPELIRSELAAATPGILE